MTLGKSDGSASLSGVSLIQRVIEVFFPCVLTRIEVLNWFIRCFFCNHMSTRAQNNVASEGTCPFHTAITHIHCSYPLLITFAYCRMLNM